ncbi:MAG: flagellar biosynthetic protein FliO, partial [Myxococcaceae bacterium]|nr:flagellar biosynthetic protein FliO [Myxococcaceae bacterium]
AAPTPAAPAEAAPAAAAPAPKAEPPAEPPADPKADIELPRSEPPELAGGEIDYGGMLFRTFVVLGLVIAVIYLTLNHGLRRLMGISAPGRSPGVLQVVDQVSLDQKQRLYVVRAAGEYLLVGGADGGLSLLSKLDTAKVDELRAAKPAAPAVTLSPLLQKLLGKRGAPPPPPGGPA